MANGDLDIERLSSVLGRAPGDPGLYENALTHASIKGPGSPDNERLEFLGDAVIDLIVCEQLYRDQEDLDEGALTMIKAEVVRDRSLAEAFTTLGLIDLLRAESSLLPPRRDPPVSILEGAFEAFVGAIYLDAGLEVTREFVLRALGACIENALAGGAESNYKALLLHLAQTRLGGIPTYRVAKEHGPDHDKTFDVIAVVSERDLGSGRGTNKKAAEQEAARASLEEMWRSGEHADVAELAALFEPGAGGVT